MATARPLGSLDALRGERHLVEVDVGWLDVPLTVVDGLRAGRGCHALGGHDLLLKYNVTCDNHLLSVVKEEPVGVVVLTCWAEICDCVGLAAQLGALVTVVKGESSAAKHVYMYKCGWLAEPALKQCLHSCGIVCAVEHVDGRVEGLAPEVDAVPQL